MSIDVPGLVRDELIRRIQGHSDSPLDAICAYALEPSGKLLRPTLLVESALAVGGSADAVLPAAVGAEYGHVASLVHDDIIDGDELRRGRPSVPERHGISTAIIIGDLLFFTMFESLTACRARGIPDRLIADAAAALTASCQDLCRGEYLEFDLIGNTVHRDVADYLAMARGKTGAGFRAACVVGAILGGGSPEMIEALSDYGSNVGIAFQIHDDLLSYSGDETALGKSITSDIHNRRLTLPVILAYQAASPTTRARLDLVLAGRLSDQAAYAETRELVRETGAFDRAHGIAAEYAGLADKSALLLPASEARDRLRFYADFATNRET
ncbi:polyprenyl synthetase family protein [Streptomyces noursei]|uniref:polyprenyl synthetase family protein n=1 Tax=Streptomyces noursei TaxID=1971 RepID=UPI0030F0A56D